MTAPPVSHARWRVFGALLTFAGLLLGSGPTAAQRPDAAGSEPQVEAIDPDGLKRILPPFSSTPFLPPSPTEGWSDVQLSASGRYLLAARTQGAGRRVHLLDPQGASLRVFGKPTCRWAAGRWGQTEATLTLECRTAPRAAPTYVTVTRANAREVKSRVPGLAYWSASGQDYVLAISPAPRGFSASKYQRYTAAGRKTGSPLGSVEPAWSPDGSTLAYLTERARPAEVPLPEWSPVREVRIIPARGQVARVVLSRAAWTNLMQEHQWRWASGPDNLVWSPAGDALFGAIVGRTGSEERRYLMRLGLKESRRDLQLVDNTTRVVTVAAAGRHWIVEMDTGFYRLEFEPAGASR